jgi:hypothetical protein
LSTFHGQPRRWTAPGRRAFQNNVPAADPGVSVVLVIRRFLLLMHFGLVFVLTRADHNATPHPLIYNEPSPVLTRSHGDSLSLIMIALSMSIWSS